MINLDQLGRRICIIGCSSSGKSTLANALAKKLNLPVYHLDQYAHLANSDWQRLSDELFIEKHQNIIKQDAWIIDGNYSVCMAPRFDHATSVIWLDPNVFISVIRYIFRSIKNDHNRAGRLPGAKKELSFGMVKWILYNSPKNRVKYQNLLNSKQNLMLLHIKSMASLKKYFNSWGLK